MSFQPISSSPDLQDLLQGLMSRIPQVQQPPSIDTLTQLFLNLSISDAPPVPLEPQRVSRLIVEGPVDLREVLMRAEGPAAAPRRAEEPVASTIGELYDLMKKHHPEQCPDEKIIRAALRELFSDSRDSPVTEILDLPNRKEQMAVFLTRYSRRLGDCSLSTITGFFVRAYLAYGPRNVSEPPPLEKFQKVASARTLDVSLDPKNAVHYRCLMWILESITIEHLLFTRMGELIRTQMAGVAMRKQLLARGCPCSSIPTARAELCLPIPDYPKDIPWPILFLRCRLARATRTLLEIERVILNDSDPLSAKYSRLKRNSPPTPLYWIRCSWKPSISNAIQKRIKSGQSSIKHFLNLWSTNWKGACSLNGPKPCPGSLRIRKYGRTGSTF